MNNLRKLALHLWNAVGKECAVWPAFRHG